MKSKYRSWNPGESVKGSISKADLDEYKRTLKAPGVNQTPEVSVACEHCGGRPTVRCNTWSGDFVDGRECQRPVCMNRLIIRTGICYCYKCGERYR